VADPAEIRRSLELILAAFNDHDLDRVMSFFVDDCVLEMPRGPHPYGARSEGLIAVKEALRARFTGIPDVHYGDAEHFVSGDTGITRWTISGTSRQGQRIEVWGCDFYTFREGKIARKNSFWKIRE